MSLFHNVIYTPKINWLIRNINYILAPLLPDKIRIHPSGKLKVNLRDHDPFYLKTNQTSFLTRELFWKKAENFEYTSIFIGLIRKVDIFFDIGANIGYYSILGCTINPSLCAYAFEPSVGVMEYMRENLQLNGLENMIIAEPVALSDAGGTIDFFEMRNIKFPTIHNLSGEHNIGTKKDRITNKVRVESTTLDTYVKSRSIEGIDLIKIDTEGAEYQILKGGENTLREHQPIVVCETLFNKIEKELDTIMRKHNYEFYNHTNEGLEQVDTLIRKEDNGVRNCFFVPPHKVNLIREWIV